MNIIYSIIINVVVFLVISFIFYQLMVKYSKGYFLLMIISYLGLSYFILFPFADFVDFLLTHLGLKIIYSHNDMVLLFDITIICFCISIFNILFAFIQRKKIKNRRLD